MDVTLPNGTVLRNIPEGTTKEEIQQKAIKSGAANAWDFANKNPEQSTMEKAVGLSQSALGGTLAGFGDEANAAFQSPFRVAAKYLKGEDSSLIDEYTQTRDRLRGTERQFAEENPKTAMGANIVGSMLPYSKMMGGANTALQAGRAGAAYGGANYLGQLNDFGQMDFTDGLTDMATSGLFAGAGTGLANTAGAVIAPRLSAGAKYLKDKGVNTTIGEKLGGAWKSTEEKLMSLPFAGDAIIGAKQRGLGEYTTAMLDDVLRPIKESVPKILKPGRQGFNWAKDTISKGYDEVLTAMNVQKDDIFSQEVDRLLEMSKRLPPKEARQFRNILEDKLLKPFADGNGTLLGKTFKETDSGLRTLYKKLQKSPDAYQSQLGDALRSAHKSMLDMGKRQNPKLGNKLSALDKSYAKLNTFADASTMAGAKEGIVNPNQMWNAMKRNSDKLKVAGGEGFDQKGIETAQSVLSATIPDSGTGARQAAMGMLGVGAGATLGLPAVGGLAATALPWTKFGQGAINKLYNPSANRNIVRGMLESFAPTAGLLGMKKDEEEDYLERYLRE